MGRRGWLRPALEAFTHSHRPAGSNFMLSYTKQLIRGRRKLGIGYQRCTRGMTTSPASVRVNDGGVTVTSGIRIGFWGGTHARVPYGQHWIASQVRRIVVITL